MKRPPVMKEATRILTWQKLKESGFKNVDGAPNPIDETQYWLLYIPGEFTLHPIPNANRIDYCRYLYTHSRTNLRVALDYHLGKLIRWEVMWRDRHMLMFYGEEIRGPLNEWGLVDPTCVKCHIIGNDQPFYLKDKWSAKNKKKWRGQNFDPNTSRHPRVMNCGKPHKQPAPRD